MSNGWGFTDRPGVTAGNAVGRGLIGGSGAKQIVVASIDAGTFIPSVHGVDNSYAEATRITHQQAGMLQAFPANMIWAGNRTEGFLQIGNAVPPPVAAAVLGELWT